MASSLAVYHPPAFIVGVDIGQMADPSALAILEWTNVVSGGVLAPRFDVRHLERIPLQTSYPAMAKLLRFRLEQLRARCAVVIDATGVGLAVAQHFSEAWMDQDPLRGHAVVSPNKPPLVTVTITAGASERLEKAEQWNDWHVAKRIIVMGLVMALQQRRLRVASALPDAAELFKEGQNFQWKLNKAGTEDLYGQWRNGMHDDLLLAVAIAVWWGTKYAPRSLPTDGHPFAVGTGNVLARGMQRSLPARGRGIG